MRGVGDGGGDDAGGGVGPGAAVLVGQHDDAVPAVDVGDGPRPLVRYRAPLVAGVRCPAWWAVDVYPRAAVPVGPVWWWMVVALARVRHITGHRPSAVRGVVRPTRGRAWTARSGVPVVKSANSSARVPRDRATVRVGAKAVMSATASAPGHRRSACRRAAAGRRRCCGRSRRRPADVDRWWRTRPRTGTRRPVARVPLPARVVVVVVVVRVWWCGRDCRPAALLVHDRFCPVPLVLRPVGP